MKVRLAQLSDVEIINSLVDNYIIDGGLIQVEPDIAKKSLRQLTAMQGVILGEYDGKVISGVAGYVMPGLFTKDKFFSSMFFYVKKSHRILTSKFLKSVENSLVGTGITRIVFGVPFSECYDKLSRFFRLMGYDLLESHYCKEI